MVCLVKCHRWFSPCLSSFSSTSSSTTQRIKGSPFLITHCSSWAPPPTLHSGRGCPWTSSGQLPCFVISDLVCRQWGRECRREDRMVFILLSTSSLGTEFASSFTEATLNLGYFYQVCTYSFLVASQLGVVAGVDFQ